MTAAQEGAAYAAPFLPGLIREEGIVDSTGQLLLHDICGAMEARSLPSMLSASQRSGYLAGVRRGTSPPPTTAWWWCRRGIDSSDRGGQKFCRGRRKGARRKIWNDGKTARSLSPQGRGPRRHAVGKCACLALAYSV